MIVDKTCPACGMFVGSPEPNALNDPTDEGTTITFRRAADGDDVAQWWHAVCRTAELRRSARRAGLTPDPVDLLDDVREALR